MLIRFSFRCVLLLLSVALAVALVVELREFSRSRGRVAMVSRTAGRPFISSMRLTGIDATRDERRDRRDFRRDSRFASPQVSAGWFQRPYPYHLDYYKMRYGGSYAPYFGNLYGTPQVVNYPPYYGPYYSGYGGGYGNGYGQPGYGGVRWSIRRILA